jgi:hypothetical protein
VATIAVKLGNPVNVSVRISGGTSPGKTPRESINRTAKLSGTELVDDPRLTFCAKIKNVSATGATVTIKFLLAVASWPLEVSNAIPDSVSVMLPAKCSGGNIVNAARSEG